METFNYKGYIVTVFVGYDGNSMFINDQTGVQIYAHKFSGCALDHAKWILG